MNYFKNIKPINAMERIEKQELCDKFDEILAKANNEDVGYVILNNDGKDGHVICPAYWMNYIFDDDFGCIINSAIRYAINRQTYMPSVVVDFVMRYINVLDMKTIGVAIEDINQNIKEGTVCDPTLWKDLKEKLLVKQAELNEKMKE
ncbi:MAG: hypothetical protein U0M60_06245 [Clostridia bacterium]|nr:hypothetical protein [Clostridia bacterium]